MEIWKNKIKLVLIFMACVITVMTIQLSMVTTYADTIVARGSCGTYTSWTLSSDGVLTISGNGAMTTKSTYAPYKSQIKALVFEEGVTSICAEAFRDYTALRGGLEFPSTLKTIGKSAFYGCEGLNGTITFKNGITSIADYAFCYCENVKGDLILPDTITTLGNSVFSYCGFDGILKISKNLSSTGISVFSNCERLHGDLVIPDKLTVLKQGMFRGCKGLDGELILHDNILEIDREAFTYCSGFKGELKLPSKLTSISTWAFFGCHGLSGTLVIPEGVGTIGYAAFHECYGFTGNTVIPKSVISIAGHAFSSCRMSMITILNPDCEIEAESATINAGIKVCGFEGSTAQDYARRYGRTFVKFNCPHEWADTYTFIKAPTETEIGVKAILCTICGEPQVGSEIETWDESIIASGYGGYRVTWKLGEAGTLWITGNGSLTSTSGYKQYQNKIKRLVIEEGITSICANAFDGFSSIKGNLVIPSTMRTIGDFAFYGCKGLDGTLTIKNGVTTIGYCAFSYCENMKGDLYLPDSITTLDTYAFSDCGFDGVLVLSSNLRTTGHSVFSGCSDFTGSLIIPTSLKYINQGMFYECSGFDELIMHDGILEIQRDAFAYCSGFKGELRIPAKLTEIPTWCFLECTGITDVLIPEGVGVIGHSAFLGCTGLRNEVILPKSVIKVEDYAFRYCRMDRLTFLNPNCTISNLSDTIGVSVKLCSLAGSTAQSYARRYGRTFIELSCIHEWMNTYSFIKAPTETEAGIKAILCSICGEVKEGSEIETWTEGIIASGSAGSGVTWKLGEAGTLWISGNGALTNDSGYSQYQTKIKRVVIEEGITSICDEAFYSYTAISSIPKFPSTLKTIGMHAFYGCEGMKGVLVLPDGLQTVGTGAFAYCPNITGDLILPDSITAIGDYAFSDSGYTGILHMPASLRDIGYSVFSGCSGFRGDIIIPEGLTYLHQSVFYECSGFDGKLVLPESLVEIRRDCFAFCSGLTGELKLPSKLTAIETWAFLGCSGFTGELVIPDGVGVIGYASFLECTGFSGTMVLPESVIKVEGHAFKDCRMDKIVVLNRDCIIENEAETFGSSITLSSFKDSTTKEYASKYGRNFEEYTCAHDTVLRYQKVPTCVSEGYSGDEVCLICGETVKKGKVIDALGHDWSEWNIDIDATCTDAGYETRYCLTCFEEEVNEIPAYGHTVELYDQKEATCTVNGYTGNQICVTCDEIIETGNVIPAIGHSWSVWTMEESPSCTESGTDVRNCLVCKEEERKTVAALGHKAELQDAKAATCTEDGYTGDQVCTVCKDMLEEGMVVKAAGHSWTEWKVIVEPTYESDGQETRTCTVCKETESRILPALFHTTELRNQKTATCTADGYTGDQVCITCGETIEQGKVIPALGHAWSGWGIRTKAACTEPGEEVRTCSTCREEETREIAALGHKCELQAVKEATCETDGYTGNQVCITCRKTIETGDVIPALGHAWSGWSVKTKATCTETGEEIKTCLICNEEETRTLAALGHKAELQGAKAATCTEDGYTGNLVCTVCKVVLEEGIAVKATGHSWTEWEVSVEPTYESDGQEIRICTACKETESRVLPALFHTTELRNQKAATCTSDGYTGDQVCITCGETIEQGKVIPALGHTWSGWSVRFKPTCTEPGEEVRSCSVCREEETRETAALGHKCELQAVKEATCETDGYTGNQVCITCRKTIETGDVIPALGHAWSGWSVRFKSTCTEPGEEVRRCSVCRKEETREKAALGHKEEIRGIKEATCTADGYTGDKVCTVCKEILEEGLVVKATGHSWSEWEVSVEPTYDSDGLEKRSCSMCSLIETRKIDKLHKDPIQNPFLDVSEKEYYYTPVLWAVEHGITTGTSATKYEPNTSCTRAQIVTFLWRSMGCPEPQSSNNPFKDVDVDAYFGKAVLWAVEQGITNGTSKTKFSPNEICNRAQIVTFLWRSMNCPEPDSFNNPFTDVDVNEYYGKAVLWAVEQGITTGTSKMTFEPDTGCTRGQVVTFLYRTLEE